MRSCGKLLLVCLVIQTGSVFAADANQPISSKRGYILGKDTLKKPTDVNQPVPNDRNREKMKEMEAMEKRIMEDVSSRKEERRIKHALDEAVVSWLADANEAAGEECDRLAESLLSIKEPEPSVKAYFTAAQVAKLRGKPQKAIAILEDVVSKYPDDQFITMTFPVRIAGRFWIGAIARHSGDMTKAKDAYEAALKDINENLQNMEGRETLAIVCGLYLAEIESSQKRNDAALSRLEAIKQIRKPEGQWAAPYEVLINWAAYQRARIAEGKKSADRLLVSYPESMDVAGVYPITIMALGGMVGEPLVGCGAGPDVSAEKANIAGYVSIKQASENKNSRIDRDLARLTGGLSCLMSKDFTGAEKYYSELFAEDSYFSPIAGIYLGWCKMEEGKVAEGNAILDKVKAKYPGYESAVNKLKRPQK